MKLRQRTITIDDPNVLKKIESENIEHVRPQIISDNGIFVAMKYPDYKTQLSFGKSWIKVYKARPGTQIRTPGFLRPYAGKEIELFEEKINPIERELFRIGSVGFDFNFDVAEKSKETQINPVFSKSGFCVIPKSYVEGFVGVNISGLKLSFNKTNVVHVNDGYLLSRITGDHEYGNLSYPIYSYGKRFRTRKMTTLINYLNDHGKDLSKFYYDKTIYSEKSKCNLIVFKEAVFE